MVPQFLSSHGEQHTIATLTGHSHVRFPIPEPLFCFLTLSTCTLFSHHASCLASPRSGRFECTTCVSSVGPFELQVRAVTERRRGSLFTLIFLSAIGESPFKAGAVSLDRKTIICGDTMGSVRWRVASAG